MTLPRLAALAADWRREPPADVLLAALLGVTPAAAAGDLADLVALAEAGGRLG